MPGRHTLLCPRSLCPRRSGLTGEPRANGARSRAGLAVAIVERALVDETEDVGPFRVGSHHEMTARREGAPQLLILIAARVGALQMSFEGVALLLRDDERREAAAPAFDLGDPIALAGPGADERC